MSYDYSDCGDTWWTDAADYDTPSRADLEAEEGPCRCSRDGPCECPRVCEECGNLGEVGDDGRCEPCGLAGDDAEDPEEAAVE